MQIKIEVKNLVRVFAGWKAWEVFRKNFLYLIFKICLEASKRLFLKISVQIKVRRRRCLQLKLWWRPLSRECGRLHKARTCLQNRQKNQTAEITFRILNYTCVSGIKLRHTFRIKIIPAHSIKEGLRYLHPPSRNVRIGDHGAAKKESKSRHRAGGSPRNRIQNDKICWDSVSKDIVVQVFELKRSCGEDMC